MKKNKEVENVMRDNHSKGLIPYPIHALPLSFTEVKQKTELLLKEHPNTDVLFYDLPGTINDEEVFKILSLLDFAFIPLEIEESVNWSSLDFYRLLLEKFDCQKYLFWNKMDRRLPRKIEYLQSLSATMRSKNMNILFTYLPLLYKIACAPSVYGDKAIKSTIFKPYTDDGVNTNIPEFCEEIYSIINKQHVND